MSRLNLLDPKISIGGVMGASLLAWAATFVDGNLKMLKLTVRKGHGPSKIRKVQDWKEYR